MITVSAGYAIFSFAVVALTGFVWGFDAGRCWQSKRQ